MIKITDKLPNNIIGIPNGCTVYATGAGDMNDLLGRHVLPEERTKDKEAK